MITSHFSTVNAINDILLPYSHSSVLTSNIAFTPSIFRLPFYGFFPAVRNVGLNLLSGDPPHIGMGGVAIALGLGLLCSRLLFQTAPDLLCICVSLLGTTHEIIQD